MKAKLLRTCSLAGKHFDAGAVVELPSIGDYKNLLAAKRIAPLSAKELAEAFPPAVVVRQTFTLIRACCVAGIGYGVNDRVSLSYAEFRELRRAGRIAKDSSWRSKP